MTTPSFGDRFKRNASGIAAVTVTGTWLAALMLGFNWWLGFMLFGYIVIVPVVAMLFDEEDESVHAEKSLSAADESDTEDTADALERLRSRYANGDLTDEQFERKLDRLLETETLEDAAEWVERSRDGDAERSRDGDAARSRDGDAERSRDGDAARSRETERDRR